MKKSYVFSDILIGIIFSLFFISISVIFVINFKPLYYLDIKFLDIPSRSGFTKNVILDNYSALIDYCSPFYKGDLVFPTLIASSGGLKHFEEVKTVFVFFYYLLPITLIPLILIILYKHKRKDYRYLLVSSITTLVLPISVGIGTWINFDHLFILFHQLVFRNDLWLFDYTTDPVILMLPDTFFMHCAVLIVCCVILCSLLLFLFYRISKRENRLKILNPYR